MTSITMLEPIPQPPGYPLVGNLFDLYSETPILHVMKLARQYGPIFGLRMPQGSNVVMASFELVDEVCDDKHFDKFLGPGLRNARAVAGDGLFTSCTQEPNWHKANNILLPNFSMQAIKATCL